MIRSRTIKLEWSFAVALAVAMLAGCSSGPKPPPMAKISGKITHKGKPMPPLTVAFTAMSGGIPADYKYVSTKTDGEGKYAIDALAEAEYMVSLIDDTPPKFEGQAIVGSPLLVKFGPESPLRTTVKAPAAEFNYDIQ